MIAWDGVRGQEMWALEPELPDGRSVISAVVAQSGAIPSSSVLPIASLAGDPGYHYLFPDDASIDPGGEVGELLRVGFALARGASVGELVDLLFGTLAPAIPCDRIGFAQLWPEGILELTHVRSTREIRWGVGARAPLAGSTLEPIIKERKIRVMDDLEAHLRVHRDCQTAPLLIAEGMRSSLTVPIVVRERAVGMMFLSSTIPGAYTATHVHGVRGMASALGLAFERALLLDEVSRAHADLLQLDRLKANFLASLSHEFRSPLHQVLGACELLSEGNLGPLNDEQRRWLSSAVSGARRLSDLIADLFDFAALRSGERAIDHIPVNLRAVVEEVATEERPRLENAGLVLAVRAESDTTVIGDPPLLARAIHALLDNARKFTPAHGAVSLRAFREGGRVRIQVADTGIGMATEDVCRAMTGFYQAEGGSTRRQGGVGIGLPLALAIARVHGGTLEITSQLGNGVVATLDLPANLVEPDYESFRREK